MSRIKLIVAYDGTHFSGWQIQPEMHGTVPRTVQGELEHALLALTGTHIRVHGAGRTDAGVHAERQVAHFDVPDGMRMHWQRALHSKLPPDVAVLEARDVPESFHARYDCQGKVYAYTLWTEAAYLPPRIRSVVWSCGTVDWTLVDQAARLLEGEHDFGALQNTGAKPGDTVRRLYAIYREVEPLSGALADDPTRMVLRFYGNGFLKQMVRNLVGFLVWVGQERLRVEDAAVLLAQRTRTCLNFPTAPARGLTLERALYSGDAPPTWTARAL